MGKMLRSYLMALYAFTASRLINKMKIECEEAGLHNQQFSDFATRIHGCTLAARVTRDF